MGWRSLLVLPLALLASLAIVLFARTLAQTPDIDARWDIDSSGRLVLLSSETPALSAAVGRSLDAIAAPGLAPLPMDGWRVVESSRWVASDIERAALVGQQRWTAQALRAQNGAELSLTFTDGSSVNVKPQPRGYASLGVTFWLLCGLALGLQLVGAVVVLVRPDTRNILYAVMAQAQALQLALAAADAVPGLGNPFLLGALEAPVRMILDIVTCGALLHATLLYPTPLPRRHLPALLTWAGVAIFSAWVLRSTSAESWWWTQALILGAGLIVIALLGWSYRLTPHPFATVLRRLSMVAVTSLALVTIVVALNDRMPQEVQALVAAVPVIWTVFVASLLLTSPFLVRSQHMMREFAMLAGVSTLATSVDLLFVAVFSLNQFASLTTSLFIALGFYAASRQWLLDQVVGARAVTTERLLEHLLRIARQIEQQPEQAADWQLELFNAVFQPLMSSLEPSDVAQTRYADGGASLRVPLVMQDIPTTMLDSAASPPPPARSIVLRYAERGKRLFTVEDTRLADRMVEQLRRAVAHDRAIEQGRSEERGRIAQDLHDDIGARLLTLMYKAPNTEMEDYVRHTLQDLKTLTRGLAATNHLLSHAAAEWKADIAQRLCLAGCDLEWSFLQDTEVSLNVVQWSGLTRILRELVSNIIAHAQAEHATIRAELRENHLSLCVSDNGIGGTPQQWATGLGLGGIRKRVRMLDGQIEWHLNTPRGVRCEVRMPLTALNRHGSTEDGAS